MDLKESNGHGLGIGLAVPDDDLLRHISAPGMLGLPKLLDSKRIEWGIPDEAFQAQCAYNKLLIWQIPLSKKDTYEGTSILKTEAVKKRDLTEAHRGIIVSGGMKSLDILRSNGMDLGHTVNFCRMAPFRKQFATISAVPLYLLIIHAGEVIDSEDLGDMLRKRECRIVYNDELGQHVFIDGNGKQWMPRETADLEE